MTGSYSRYGVPEMEGKGPRGRPRLNRADNFK